MADTFQKVRNKFGDSPAAIVIFIASFAMLAIGLNLFAEDTYSSYLGLKSLETDLGLNIQIFGWTYWVMALAPQIASVVFFYMFLSTGERKYLLISLAAQAMDSFADVWYRSDGRLFDDPRAAIVSLFLTFIFFTVCSEGFVSIGAGLTLKLFAPAVREFKRAFGDVKGAYAGGGGPQKQNQRPQNQFPKPPRMDEEDLEFLREMTPQMKQIRENMGKSKPNGR